MDKKYGEFVGVDNLYFAEVTQDSLGGYSAGTPEYLAPVAEIAGEPEVNNNTTYYDNKPAHNYVTEGTTEIAITASNVPAQLMARLLGKAYDAATGRVYDDGEPNPPNIALGFRYNLGKNDYRYYWYYLGTLSGGAEEGTSKSGDVDVKNYQLTYTALKTAYEWSIDGQKKSLKRTFADTTDDAFDSTGWFEQVQTPDAVGSPTALELSSSNPTDNDTGVAVDISPTITFNNKINSYAVTLINPATLAVISSAISLDETGKNLTINPAADLAALTEYAVIVSNVTDVYGQSLQDTVINFTTA